MQQGWPSKGKQHVHKKVTRGDSPHLVRMGSKQQALKTKGRGEKEIARLSRCAKTRLHML